MPKLRLAPRHTETVLLCLAIGLAFLGFIQVAAAAKLRQPEEPWPALGTILFAPAVLAITLLAIHLVLSWRGLRGEQIILPVTGLLAAIGLTVIGRLQGWGGVWQQLSRGWLPGIILMAALILRPAIIERVRREWPVLISLGGLLLLLLTAFFGVLDESGARLSLKLGPLPPVQTTEVVKLALVIFLAWYIESEGEKIEGRPALVIGPLRLPAPTYFIPGLLFVALATLALVKMSDFGAILILGSLFVAMLYAGFQPAIFAPIVVIALVLSLLMGLILLLFWDVPAVIQYRIAAFLDPWSQEPLLANGEPTGLTIAEGPGYQIQQSVYAMIAGGLTGTGLGFGTPEYIPLAHSDFIFAPLVEELGVLAAMAILALYAILLLRLLRLAILLPEGQIFERLLLVGITVHLFTQIFVMIGGTVNLLPLTGVTVPFLSQGGMAMMVNLTEIGLALALAQRLGGQGA
jgi:cell division protein FtsW (lipid II flippase)